MFDTFKEESRKVLVLAKKEMYELKHPYVGSEHLLLAILKTNNSVTKKIKEYGLNYQAFKKEIINTIGIGTSSSKYFIYTPLLKRVIENAVLDSKESNNGEVTVENLFSGLLEEGEGVAIRLLIGMNIDMENLYTDFAYKINNNGKKTRKLILEELGVDLTKKALNNELDPVIGRENEIKRTLEILLRRTKNNPLLIGEAGVGKTAIVEELSRMIVNNEVPLCLRNKRIISLDMASVVAGTKYRGEFEERVRKILKEAEDNDDIILFIDEIHTLVGAGGAEGAIDASNIFKPALARNKLKCIGATTTSEYKKSIETDSALERRFQKIIIETPNQETVKEILVNLKGIYENYHKVSISDKIIDLIIEVSNKYIYDRNEPDKSIDILDEVCASVSLKENKILKKYNSLNKEMNDIINKKNNLIMSNNFNEALNYKEKEKLLMNEINNLELELYKKTRKEVTKEDVAKIINLKTKIPVYEILSERKTIINNINKDMIKHIKGQDKAINKLTEIAKIIKLGYADKKCYSLMFVGSSGVGKTELAKVFGNGLVNKSNVIKLDMSEFNEAHSVSKLIGSPPGYIGYADNKNIFEEIRLKPYSVLILDEVEKAHVNIINLFFQILDDGKIKDAKGNVIRFDNVIIIMTSNMGFNEKSIGFKNQTEKILLTKLKETFSLPFINRIDNIIVFNDLSESVIENIVKTKIVKLKSKYKKQGINLIISKNVIFEIIELCNYEEFGARKIDKVIKEKIENAIIEKILDDQKIIKIKSVMEISV